MTESAHPHFKQRIVIKGGRVIDPHQILDKVADIYIADGVIAGIDSAPQGFKADLELDARGQLVIPGAVDLCARIREPGQSQKGSIYSETLAAAAAGITHLCCPPDTNPAIDTRAVASLIQERAHQSGYTNVLPIGALTKGLEGQQLSEMHSLREAGCIGVSQLRYPVKDTQVLLRCLEYASTFDLIVFFQSEDQSISPSGGVHSSATATRLGLPTIPECAETIALCRDLLLVEHTGVTAHFGQISCARSVDLIAAAQSKGLPVTADVALHQLYLYDEMINGFNSQYHVNPPLRSKADRQGLIDGVKAGVISVLCSDHQPHEAAAKLEPFPTTATGISGFSSFLPLSYKLVKNGILTESEWVQRISMNPARLIGVDTGHLSIGSNANICVFDPEEQWTLTPHSIVSQGKNSPFLGSTLNGRVKLTVKDGAISFRDCGSD
ncbi:dihydroorotase [Ketobacter sp. MCCC 1A13808]|uniref:dihydroorotase n=1 Tax=Ketobacter sp. MCCC 1A13808 TaxID=2602738 RepID=UPI0012EC2ECE|nr:dihydroorotase [Ketobacter sp. MCCC 1A13808]MVF13653.1 dihydroorotase [Ketobacter sp. MCCC 1A13808]